MAPIRLIYARMQDTLQEEYGHQYWSQSLSQTVKLDGPGLRYSTLFANVSDVSQFGTDTFRLTGRKMSLIASLSHELSRPGGTIEKMLGFCDPSQSELRDRHLKRYLKRGQKDVDDCATAIREVNEAFRMWSEMTANLLKALENMNATNASKTKTVEKELGETKAGKGLEEKEQARDEELLREKRAELKRNLDKIKGDENEPFNFVEIIFGTRQRKREELSALRDRASRLADNVASRETPIEKMAAEAAQLQATLEKLSSEKSFITEVTKIVQRAVRRLTELQSQIQTFMNFLEEIASIINRTLATSELVYETVEDTKSMMDSQIKQAEHAFEMTTRFTFASRASAIYNAVSARYIIPTIEQLPNLCLHDAGTNSEVNEKLKQLNQIRNQVSHETLGLMHTALKQDHMQIAKKACASFEFDAELVEDHKDED
ncbi:hypothetical protein PT974_11246 [Cladobotryum mycophilum]|uniref:Uncharacterized protein n=1 Tax=Cladobotryum mycophilum TaxID=491253 RepID=A0ABR0S4P3_9HYPO